MSEIELPLESEDLYTYHSNLVNCLENGCQKFTQSAHIWIEDRMVEIQKWLSAYEKEKTISLLKGG